MGEQSWYLAVLVVESSVEGSDCDPLLDLQHRLVFAGDAEDAYRKALELGKSAEHSYENPYEEMVCWRFAGLHDLRELDDQELVHGAEVYSRMYRSASDSYVVPKEQLTEFSVSASAGKTAREILGDE